jgi:SCP-2 sterol transfer family
MINDSLSSSDAERKEAIQKGKGIFGFTLKNKDGKEDSWYIDLKEAGKVTKEAPKKADGTFWSCSGTGRAIELTVSGSYPVSLG